jgi:hypothetical protein
MSPAPRFLLASFIQPAEGFIERQVVDFSLFGDAPWNAQIAMPVRAIRVETSDQFRGPTEQPRQPVR